MKLEGVSKRFGKVPVLSDVSFSAKSGQVTALLGPNGAGKSTALRVLLGLVTQTEGTATVGGRPLNQHPEPLAVVGSLLDQKAFHGRRSAEQHLSAIAIAHGIPISRVRTVLHETGLSDAVKRPVHAFSLGMSQRLGLATALLSDPACVVLDEPANGLDPRGLVWVRETLAGLASEGRAVLLSSHQMPEVAKLADHVIVIDGGRVIADSPIDSFVENANSGIRIRTPHPDRLGKILETAGALVLLSGSDGLTAHKITSERIGDLALANEIALHQLVERNASLEEAYLALFVHVPENG